MWSERLRKLLFESSHVCDFIETLLAAFIAPDGEGALKTSERCESIRLGKGYFVSVEKILPKMKPMILAYDHPTIMGVFPHTASSKPSYGWAG
jgi:hypothetical protein